VVTGPAMLPDLPESSGLAVSRRTPGILWSHNDSGHESVLIALDAAGAVHGRVRVPRALRDWEDISAGSCGGKDCLYLADIGDNARERPRIQIVVVPEPAPGDQQTSASDVFNAIYTDGAHNAEALFVVGDDLFIVTRDRTGGLYRARIRASGSADLVFERLGELGLEAITDAETSRDGASVVVRTSHEAVLYRTADVTNGAYVPYLRIPIDGLMEPQGEAVALDGGTLYLSSEGNAWNRAGRLLSLRCDLLPAT